MLKKSITYTDYNGAARTEEFYFNLTKAELIELEIDVTNGGDLESWAKSVVATNDNRKLYELFKRIIMTSYGVKSPDGRRFMKSVELAKEFAETEAYSELIVEFFQNPDSLSAFFNQLVRGAEAPADKPVTSQLA